jgi:hypothetical protein
MANPMPNAAIKFPLRAVAGLLKNFNPNINVTEAMR